MTNCAQQQALFFPGCRARNFNALVRRTIVQIDRVAAAFGSKSKVGDPEGLPILLLIVSVLGLFAQPVLNGVTRMGESEADAYSLRTVNLPDALSAALVKTAEYRYPRPSALQEAIFYSHPSVEKRVRRAMDWKAQQLKKAETP